MADNVKQRSGVEMRALRDQRLAAQADPATEAIRREASFLKNLTGARDDYNWLVENKAWKHLGYESFTGWYQARVQPMLMAIGARPTTEISADVIERAREEDAPLPALQRRTQREVAELAMTSQATVSRSLRDAPASAGDLEEVSSRPTAPKQRPAPVTVSAPVTTYEQVGEPEPAAKHCPTCTCGS